MLADPGHCCELYGTRDDFLIPSACLNATVSGLVSRTVLSRTVLRPGAPYRGLSRSLAVSPQCPDWVLSDPVALHTRS